MKRQDKYEGLNFEESLEVSQVVPEIVKKVFLSQIPFFKTIEENFDKLVFSNPYYNFNIDTGRYHDIIFKDDLLQRFIYVECKDFCRLRLHDATGLPQDYVDKISSIHNDDVIIAMIDNQGLLDARFNPSDPKMHKFMSGCDNQLDLAEKMDFWTVENSKPKPIVYCQKLSVLMKNVNKELSYGIGRKPILSCFGRDRKVKLPQYLWNIDNFISIGDMAKLLAKESSELSLSLAVTEKDREKKERLIQSYRNAYKSLHRDEIKSV